MSEDYWLTPGNDAFGFDSRPAGKYNSITGRFEDLNGYTGYWASDGNPTETTANYLAFSYYCNKPEKHTAKCTDGLSVRCVMD